MQTLEFLDVICKIFLVLGVPHFLYKVYRQLGKVENHCSGSKRASTVFSVKLLSWIFFTSIFEWHSDTHTHTHTLSLYLTHSHTHTHIHTHLLSLSYTHTQLNLPPDFFIFEVHKWCRNTQCQKLFLSRFGVWNWLPDKGRCRREMPPPLINDTKSNGHQLGGKMSPIHAQSVLKRSLVLKLSPIKKKLYLGLFSKLFETKSVHTGYLTGAGSEPIFLHWPLKKILVKFSLKTIVLIY